VKTPVNQHSKKPHPKQSRNGLLNQRAAFKLELPQLAGGGIAKTAGAEG
jgi:hypothetical protein